MEMEIDTNHELKLQEFQNIVTKMPLEVVCVTVLPELGLRWPELRQAINNARLPMTSASVAKILRRHVSKTLQEDELDEIVAQLRIKSVACLGGRVWHAIKLLDPLAAQEPPAAWSRKIVGRAVRAARGTVRGHNASVEVHTTKVGDFVFLSLQPVSPGRRGAPLFVAAPPGEPVAFATSLGARALLEAAVNGIGYRKYADASLNGKDLMSLLRIINRTYNVHENQLTELQEYDPKPVITSTGIDYTNAAYDKNYVDNLIGPDPPLLTNLEIKSERTFFDPTRLNKNIAVTLTLKSDNIASTLKNWVGNKTIPPTSEFLKIFHHIKTNKITYSREEDDE